MSTEGPVPPAAGRGRRLPAVLLAAAVAVVLVAVAAVAAVGSRSTTAPSRTTAAAVTSAPTPSAAPAPSLALAGLAAGRVPWSAPLRVTATDGTLTEAHVVGPAGALPGAVTASGWQSSATLLPDAHYAVTATVRDAAGDDHTLPLTATTTPAERLLKVLLSPGDDDVVGVGRPVEVRFSRDVTDSAARAKLIARMSVSASPTVTGAWHWVDDHTVHYRPAQFWRPGTKVAVKVDLQRLSLPDEVWGSGGHTTSFRIGSSLISTVDAAAHTMTVRRDGTVLRVLRASMGRPQFATRNGTFLVLEKESEKVMDSATVNLPPGTPAYRTTVKDAVRISYSGTFVHGAPWSVPDQGVRNVSHGCINLSPADAAWYFGLAKRGDVVQVVNSTRGPLAHDPGSQDWNMPFSAWAA